MKVAQFQTCMFQNQWELHIILNSDPGFLSVKSREEYTIVSRFQPKFTAAQVSLPCLMSFNLMSH